MKEQPKSISLKKDLSESELAELNKLSDYQNDGVRKLAFSNRVVAMNMIARAVSMPQSEICTHTAVKYCKEGSAQALVDSVRNELKRMNCEAFIAPNGLGTSYLKLNKPDDSKRAESYRFAALRAYFHGEEISGT